MYVNRILQHQNDHTSRLLAVLLFKRQSCMLVPISPRKAVGSAKEEDEASEHIEQVSGIN